MLEFRDLTEEDIDVRVQSCTEKGVVLLLYKNARVDMNILDETVGVENWQSRFYECCGNLFCSVGINVSIDDIECWIWKDDSGVEGMAGEIKSTASDARKRAGFVWGIGRELYSSPFIYVNKDNCNIRKFNKNGKDVFICKDNFVVEKIKIENKKITGLSISNATTGKRCFVWAKN